MPLNTQHAHQHALNNGQEYDPDYDHDPGDQYDLLSTDIEVVHITGGGQSRQTGLLTACHCLSRPHGTQLQTA